MCQPICYQRCVEQYLYLWADSVSSTVGVRPTLEQLWRYVAYENVRCCGGTPPAVHVYSLLLKKNTKQSGFYSRDCSSVSCSNGFQCMRQRSWLMLHRQEVPPPFFPPPQLLMVAVDVHPIIYLFNAKNWGGGRGIKATRPAFCAFL
ncbi:hypothetical protein, unlikely [Trypanosoma brucei gambiense DAL972]|uniref:Uncharacterized protein n=1 Tax=Trypanosoma brucei gambiense (strain MHOM/CI/86/DAL972) TaxID=679716 RepID=C9ZJM6_TRYB9|nr:hypothetical protein, unlikely [Trypanosoma brucei gambiense DAL972]CBH09585.1 hypothetical protein, unlikely [Trypanosoma brucei gambiense DAL972]|eukprot:XP_011771890.1 hypothetical protein, unlikely [Trypanosoma brucei gambiense DAL972]